MLLQEKELVQKARDGDREALEMLLYDNYKIVFGYLFKLTMNEETARDIAQEVMVRAIVNIGSFKGDSKFSTWLVTIASNIYRDNIRKNKRISDVEIENIKIEAADNVEATVINRDNINRLKKLLLQLPDEKRMVFILKHYYNYSYEEIAKILKCPVGTVRSRLHYCIMKLKDLI